MYALLVETISCIVEYFRRIEDNHYVRFFRPICSLACLSHFNSKDSKESNCVAAVINYSLHFDGRFLSFFFDYFQTHL